MSLWIGLLASQNFKLRFLHIFLGFEVIIYLRPSYIYREDWWYIRLKDSKN